MSKHQPWLRLTAAAHFDPKVRRARAGAVWPWVLCRLKDGDGVVSADDLDPVIASQDCHIPEDLADAQMSGLYKVGLIVEADGGGWTTPNWDAYQPATSRDRMRKLRLKQKDDAVHSDVTSTNPAPCDVTLGQSDVTSRARVSDGTGRDGTGRDTENTNAASAAVPAGLTAKEVIAVEVIGHWADAFGKSAKAKDHTTIEGKRRLKAVVGRLKAGATVDQCLAVIDSHAADVWRREKASRHELATILKPVAFQNTVDDLNPAPGSRLPADYWRSDTTPASELPGQRAYDPEDFADAKGGWDGWDQ